MITAAVTKEPVLQYPDILFEQKQRVEHLTLSIFFYAYADQRNF